MLATHNDKMTKHLNSLLNIIIVKLGNKIVMTQIYKKNGKRDSSPRFACAISRELYLHPQPLEGVFGVASVEPQFRNITKRKKTAVSCLLRFVSGKRDSNSRPQPWQGCALPTELFPHYRLNYATDISIVLRVQRYSIFIYFQNFLRKILKKCIFLFTTQAEAQ